MNHSIIEQELKSMGLSDINVAIIMGMIVEKDNRISELECQLNMARQQPLQPRFNTPMYFGT